MTDFGRPTLTSDFILRANKTLGLRSFEMRQAQTLNEAQFRRILHYCRSRRHPVRDTTIFMVSFYAGLWQSVPLRVLAPHRWPDQSGPKRHGMPFSRLLFVMLKTPPHMGFYYTPLSVVLRGFDSLDYFKI